MAKTLPTTASAFLQLARLEAGLSQRELAERAGVTQSEIARIESGTREPSIPTLQKILAGAGLELRFRLDKPRPPTMWTQAYAVLRADSRECCLHPLAQLEMPE